MATENRNAKQSIKSTEVPSQEQFEQQYKSFTTNNDKVKD